MFFLDSNILVYAYDQENIDKHLKAKELLSEAVLNDKGLISSQVVQEFCNVILHKFDSVIKPYDLTLILNEVLFPIWHHTPSADYYRGAIQLFKDNSLSFYDSLIVRAALDLGCDVLYSEDLQDSQQFGKLKVVNPFK